MQRILAADTVCSFGVSCHHHVSQQVTCQHNTQYANKAVHPYGLESHPLAWVRVYNNAYTLVRVVIYTHI